MMEYLNSRTGTGRIPLTQGLVDAFNEEFNWTWKLDVLDGVWRESWGGPPGLRY